MRFTLFTDKTVSQCMRALNERLQAKPTKTRPELEGWIEKGGAFSLAITSKVAGRFPRTTRLTARTSRESGVTVVRGFVPDGVSPYWLRLLLVMLLLIVGTLVLIGKPMLGVVTFLFGGLAYIPLRGDYINSDRLLIEVEKTLKATPKPPKGWDG